MSTSSTVSERMLRLAAYLLALDAVSETVVNSAGAEVACAAALAEMAGVSSGQLRLDMSWLRRRTGQRFGLQGVGYNLSRMRQVLQTFLGVGVPRTVAVLGQDLVADAVRSALKQGTYFVPVPPDASPDFVVLAGEGPFPKVPGCGRVVYWDNWNMLGLLRLLLALAGEER